jgi:hypothetical protein
MEKMIIGAPPNWILTDLIFVNIMNVNNACWFLKAGNYTLIKTRCLSQISLKPFIIY